MKSIRHISAAAGVLTLAAVAALTSAASQNSSVSPEAPVASADTIRITKLAASKPAQVLLPSTPDSLTASENAFSADEILDGIIPPKSVDLHEYEADYTTMLPDADGRYLLSKPMQNSDGNSEAVAVQKLRTRIRPDGFFKGELLISTHGAAKAYINGKEVASKSALDSVAKDFSADFTLEPHCDALIEIHSLSSSKAGKPSLSAAIVPDAESRSVTLKMDPSLKTLFNIFSISAGPRIESAQPSPDGKYLLIKSSYSADGDQKDYSVSVQEAATGKIVAEEVPTDASWLSHSDATLYYDEDLNGGLFRIRTLEIPSLKRNVLANNLPESAAGYVLSPDNKFIVYYTDVKGEADTGVMGRVKSLDDRQPGKRDRSYLSMMNLDDRISRPLTYGGVTTYMLDISNDSRRILYYTTRETPDQFPFYDVKLIDMDVQTLKADTIPGIESSFYGALYSPDAKKLLVLAGPNAFDGVGLNAGSHEWGNDFDIQAYIYDIANHDVRPMTCDFNPSITSDAIWNPADGIIYFRAQKGYDACLYTLDPKSGEIKEIPTAVDFVRNYGVSTRKANTLAYTGMSYDYMGRAYEYALKSGKTRLIADPMADALAGINLGGSEPFTFTASDGTEIEGTITFPPDFDPSKKYPMITYYYGGTTPNTHTNHSPYTPNLFASRGYIVYSVNPSGTIGYGQEFSARHVNAWGDRTADDIIEGVKAVCEKYPQVKKDKIGCIGASYGGFMTQLLQTKTDIFAAAVSHAGISNITSYWGEGYWGYSYNAVAAARSYPWNNPKLFTENSPLFHADKIHTPLLLLHGNQDTNVPIGESIQLYNALKILGRPVEFITVDKQNHIIMDFQKRREWHATIMAWFERWLKDDPRWWNSIYKD